MWCFCCFGDEFDGCCYCSVVIVGGSVGCLMMFEEL